MVYSLQSATICLGATELSIDQMDLEWFSATRAELDRGLNELVLLNVICVNPRLLTMCKSLTDKVRRYSFNLVMLGEFKRGKSTLVNALLGAAVLPTGVVPLTAITTMVCYGEEPLISVIFEDSTTEIFPFEELEKYVTERGNPKNRLAVRVVEVAFAAALLRDGVRIVDTPGTGSVHRHNTKTTYTFLPEADAAIFVFSADQPASLNELQFLKDAGEFIDRFFFVQNKIDTMTEAEQLESLQFLKETLQLELGRECSVYPVSAKIALKSKTAGSSEAIPETFAQLERGIFGFLATEKAKTFTQSIVAKLRRFAGEAKQLLDLEIQTSLLSANSLELSAAQFRSASQKILQQQSDADHIVSGEMKKLLQAIEVSLQPVVEANTEKIQTKVTSAFDEHQHLSKEELIFFLQETLCNEIATAFAPWNRHEESLVAQSFAKIMTRFVERSNSIVQEISQLTSDLFDVKFQTTFEIEPLVTTSKHYFTVDNPFTLSFQMLPLALPSSVAKPVIRERFIQSVRPELSRNAGRLRADLQVRIEETGRQFLKHFHTAVVACLREIEDTLERASQRKIENAEEQESISKSLRCEMAQVETLLATLKEISAAINRVDQMRPETTFSNT